MNMKLVIATMCLIMISFVSFNCARLPKLLQRQSNLDKALDVAGEEGDSAAERQQLYLLQLAPYAFLALIGAAVLCGIVSVLMRSLEMLSCSGVCAAGAVLLYTMPKYQLLVVWAIAIALVVLGMFLVLKYKMVIKQLVMTAEPYTTADTFKPRANEIQGKTTKKEVAQAKKNL